MYCIEIVCTSMPTNELDMGYCIEIEFHVFFISVTQMTTHCMHTYTY